MVMNSISPGGQQHRKYHGVPKGPCGALGAVICRPKNSLRPLGVLQEPNCIAPIQIMETGCNANGAKALRRGGKKRERFFGDHEERT